MCPPDLRPAFSICVVGRNSAWNGKRYKTRNAAQRERKKRNKKKTRPTLHKVFRKMCENDGAWCSNVRSLSLSAFFHPCPLRSHTLPVVQEVTTWFQRRTQLFQKQKLPSWIQIDHLVVLNIIVEEKKWKELSRKRAKKRQPKKEKIIIKAKCKLHANKTFFTAAAVVDCFNFCCRCCGQMRERMFGEICTNFIRWSKVNLPFDVSVFNVRCECVKTSKDNYRNK